MLAVRRRWSRLLAACILLPGCLPGAGIALTPEAGRRRLSTRVVAIGHFTVDPAVATSNTRARRQAEGIAGHLPGAVGEAIAGSSRVGAKCVTTVAKLEAARRLSASPAAQVLTVRVKDWDSRTTRDIRATVDELAKAGISIEGTITDYQPTGLAGPGHMIAYLRVRDLGTGELLASTSLKGQSQMQGAGPFVEAYAQSVASFIIRLRSRMATR